MTSTSLTHVDIGPLAETGPVPMWDHARTLFRELLQASALCIIQTAMLCYN